MKLKKTSLIILVIAAAAALFGSILYVNLDGAPANKAILFVTLGTGRSTLPNEVSSYEIERATEHFADVFLGWTVEPSFQNELTAIYSGLSYTATRQEKESLIFTISGSFDSTEPADKFLALSNNRLKEYNKATGANYMVALHRETFMEGYRNDWRFVLGTLLITLIVTGSLLTLKEYAATCRCS